MYGAAASRWSSIACALGVTLTWAGPAPAASHFKLELRDSGVYRVDYAELAAVAALPQHIESARLGLREAGGPVALWVEDGGDGVWGPGDWLEFVGRARPGRRGPHSEVAPDNVYRLDLRAESPLRMQALDNAAPASRCTPRTTGYRGVLRAEENRLRVRFPGMAEGEGEVWFWSKLTQVDAEPFTYTIDLRDLDSRGRDPLRLRIGLRGWSRLPEDAAAWGADHRLELSINGHAVGHAEWDNAPDGYVLDLALARNLLRPGANRLELRVPERRLGSDPRPRIDAVLLNWIELSYPSSPAQAPLPARFLPEWPGGGPGCLVFERPDTVLLYGETGGRALSRPVDGWHHLGPWPAGAVYLLHPDALRHVRRVLEDRSSAWRESGRRADLIIIAHPRLLEAVRPLAEFHRQRGLQVALVDVEDVYDEFSEGLVDPQALRDFLEYASRSWQRPAPRYVLLVGDASWDPWNPEVVDENYADWTYRPQHAGAFGKNESTPYRKDAGHNGRNLIPTWSHATREGQAASDNGFVDFGGDGKPQMAIGRWPVTEPAEVRAIVAKTVRYAGAPEPGPWRRRVLWVTNEAPAFQRRSDLLARALPQLESRKLYPTLTEDGASARREELLQALDEGELFVHFLGHGGRYIWRTGPPDLTHNRDLFTLEDLDRLAPSARLPIVFSMTCYSAPFDHPNADSIGEKFLRIEGRGAVAVVAASWRNSPTERMSRLLLEEFSRQSTIGEAFLRAKQRSNDPDFLYTYNLLGDPATPIARQAAAPLGGAP